MENPYRLDIAFYRGEVDEHRPFQGLDFGPLFDGLVTTPRSFANVDEAGTIKLEIQRTHEWELLLVLVVTGSALFMKGVLSELGKRTGAWLAGQVAKLKTSSQPAIRVGQDVVRIDPDATNLTTAAVVAVLAKGVEGPVQVQVIIEPRR